MNNAEKARLAREAREREEQEAREAKLRAKQAKKDARRSRREDRQMDRDDRREERRDRREDRREALQERREENAYRNKYWTMFIILFIVSIPAIVAQLLGLLIFTSALESLRVYIDIILLVQKIGFYASVAAIIGVIIAYIVGNRLGDNWQEPSSEIEDHKLGFATITIFAIACAALCLWTAINGDLTTRNYYVDTDRGVVYAEKSSEYTVYKFLNGHDEVTIAATLNGKRVGAVSGMAGRGNSFIVSLNFEDNGNWEIKNKAFADCARLTDVTFGSNSTYMLGKKAFDGCLILKNIDCGEGSVYTIKKKAFNECPSLETFNVRSSKITVNEAPNEYMQIFGGKTNATMYVNGGSVAYLADQIGGLVVGPKSIIEIAAYEAYNGNPIVLNVAKVVFEEGFDFQDSTLRISNAGLQWFTEVTTYHPFGDTIYLPTSITYIPDNFFGDDGKNCIVYFAGTSEQWNAIVAKMGSNGNSNYDNGKVDVRFTSNSD